MEVTRRDLLRLSAYGTAAALAAPLLAGCGDDEPAASSGSAPSPSASAATEQLAPFEPGRPAGPATGLPRRVAWANTTPIGIFAALGAGMQRAAGDRQLDYLTANAEGDPQANVNQINTFLARGVGGLTIQPLNAEAQAPVMRTALDRGACVIGIITQPCTMQIAASQYEIGLQQGRAAARYITDELGGKATVFNANLDQLAPELARRGKGVMDGLAEAGKDVRIIDEYVAPKDQTRDRVFEIVNNQLQRNPDIRVVLGVDGFVLPAYRAFEQTGKLTPQHYFSSIDGDPEALALVAAGGAYKASLAFPWTLMGYGMGRFVADWVEGRSIPRVMVAKASLIDSPAAAQDFLAAAKDPKSTFEDAARYQSFLPLLGNVSHAERATTWTTTYQL